jgi:hypothetical protein
MATHEIVIKVTDADINRMLDYLEHRKRRESAFKYKVHNPLELIRLWLQDTARGLDTSFDEFISGTGSSLVLDWLSKRKAKGIIEEVDDNDKEDDDGEGEGEGEGE